MGRPSGVNLSEAERIVLGDRALALKLRGMTYEEIGAEIGVHRNTVGSLILDAARRRSADRDLTDEINRAIALRRQTIEELWRRMRELPRSGTQAAFAYSKLADQVRKAQMELLFLSGVEVPDPEQAIMDTLEAMRLPMPELPSYPGEASVMARRAETSPEESEVDDPGEFFFMDDSVIHYNPDAL